MAVKFKGGKAVPAQGINTPMPKGWTKAEWDATDPWQRHKIGNRLPVPVAAGDLRHAILELGDKVYGAEDNVNALSPDIKAEYQKLMQQYRIFTSKLDQKYLWDSYGF